MIHFISAAVIIPLAVMIHSIPKTASLWVIVKSNLSSAGAWILVPISPSVI